jgi:hypothetical protein
MFAKICEQDLQLIPNFLSNKIQFYFLKKYSLFWNDLLVTNRK